MRALLIILTLCFTLGGCGGIVQEESPARESFPFSENLSSISQGEGMIWIGTECSVAYLFNGATSKKYDFGTEGQIYKILPKITAQSDTLLYVGVRNSGVHLFSLKENHPHLLKSYILPLKKKSRSHSPYDFQIVGSTLYVGTSNGFYRKNVFDTDDTLELVYPSAEFLAKKSEFGCYSVQKLDENKIAFSSPEGVLVYDALSSKVERRLDGVGINSLSVYRDTIFALSDKYLYSLGASVVDSIECVNSPLVYFEDLNANKWLLGANRVRVGRGSLDKRFKDIDILDKTLPNKCRNVVITDPKGYFTYMITKNEIWKIPRNIDIYNDNPPVKAACEDELGDIYIITTANTLYLRKKTSQKAQFLCSLNIDKQVEWVDVLGGVIYLRTASSVYVMGVPSGLFDQIRPREFFVGNDIFSSHLHRSDTTLYLGGRLGLYIIDSEGRVDTIVSMANKFVTSIFHNCDVREPDHIYVSTLNDGMYHSVGKTHKWFGESLFAETKDICDVLCMNSGPVILTTAAKLLTKSHSLNPQTANPKSLLRVNDTTFFTVHQRGMDRYAFDGDSVICKGSYFRDLELSAGACFVDSDGEMFVAGQMGAFTVDPLNISANDVIEWVEFDSQRVGYLRWIIFVGIAMITVAAVVLYYFRRQRKPSDQLTQHRDQQIRVLKGHIGELKVLFDKDDKILLRVQDVLSDSKKNSQNTEELFKNLGELYLEMLLLLPSIIDRQLTHLHSLNCTHSKHLQERSTRAKHQAIPLSLRDQAIENHLWITSFEDLKLSLRVNIDILKEIPQIEGLSKGLLCRLQTLLSALQTTGDITLCTEKYEHIESQITPLFSAASNDKIQKYIAQQSSFLSSRADTQLCGGLIEFLQTSVSEHKSDNLLLLKSLGVLEHQISIIECLDAVKGLCKEENIEKHSEHIRMRISEFYKILNDSDREILSRIIPMDNTQTQAHKVLAVLLGEKKIKSSKLPAIIGVYSNLNAVKSRLLSQIKANSSSFEELVKGNFSANVVLIKLLDLLD